MEIHPGLVWAVIALVLLAGSSMEDKVTQRQEDVSRVERGAVTLDCTYETGESNYDFFWYKQSPGGSLVFLLWQYSAGAKESEAGPRFTADFWKPQRSLRLRISDLQPSNSATYFCAFRGSTVIKPTGSLWRASRGRSCVEPPTSLRPTTFQAPNASPGAPYAWPTPLLEHTR